MKEKMCQYIKYMLGGSKFWLGRSMKDAHSHLKISEDHFDVYYRSFTTTLKQIKTPVKIMQVLMKKVNELREDIVNKEEPEVKEDQSVSLFTVLGEEQGIQGIVKLA